MKLSRLLIYSAVAGAIYAKPLLADDIETSTSTQVESELATTQVTNERSLQPLLQQISQQAILPMYKQADEQATALQRQVIAFCNSTNLANLTATREQWANAINTWQVTEVALFGPALSQQRDLHIYFRPVKKRVIKKLLTQDSAISMDNLEFAGVGAQGFATLEFLLFDRDKTDDDIFKQFVGNDGRYCQHLLASSTMLQRDISSIYREWQGSYADALAKPGHGENPIFANSTQALEMALGKLDQSAEAVINKLRNPLAKAAQLSGKDEARDSTNAYKLEAWRSGHSLANILANIQGIEQVLKQGGILEWLKQHNEADLATQLEQQLTAIRDIQFPGTDLFAQVEAKDLTAADALFDETLALSKLIHNTAPKLGVQLGFNDSDGD